MNHQTQNTKFNSTPSLPQIRDHVDTSPTPFSTASPCAQRSQQFPGCPLLVSLGATETCQSCLCQVVGIARLVLQQLITPGVGLGGGGEVGGVPTDPINLYIYIINLLYGLQKSGSCSLVLNHPFWGYESFCLGSKCYDTKTSRVPWYHQKILLWKHMDLTTFRMGKYGQSLEVGAKKRNNHEFLWDLRWQGPKIE